MLGSLLKLPLAVLGAEHVALPVPSGAARGLGIAKGHATYRISILGPRRVPLQGAFCAQHVLHEREVIEQKARE